MSKSAKTPKPGYPTFVVPRKVADKLRPTWDTTDPKWWQRREPEWACLPVDELPFKVCARCGGAGDLPIIGTPKTCYTCQPLGDRSHPGRVPVEAGDRVTIATLCEKYWPEFGVGIVDCPDCQGSGSVPVFSVEIDRIVPVAGPTFTSTNQPTEPTIEVVSPSYVREWYQDADGDWMHRQLPADMSFTKEHRFAVFFKRDTWETT